MRLDQFTFKPSKNNGFKEEARQPTGKLCFVDIFKNDEQYTVVKTLNGVVVYNVMFPNVEKLNKCLKNISKRK